MKNTPGKTYENVTRAPEMSMSARQPVISRRNAFLPYRLAGSRIVKVMDEKLAELRQHAEQACQQTDRLLAETRKLIYKSHQLQETIRHQHHPPPPEKRQAPPPRTGRKP
jgi:hypothetical protein